MKHLPYVHAFTSFNNGFITESHAMEYTIQVNCAVYSNIPTVISYLLQALEQCLCPVTFNLVVEKVFLTSGKSLL